MDKLKEFIERNKSAFDCEPLPEGHLERFEKKLRRQSPSILRRYLLPIVATAAAACLILFFLRPQNNNDAEPSLFVCDADEEMDELREYYNMRVYDMEEQIRTLHEAHPTPGTRQLLEETENVIETVREFEADIFPTLPCTDNGLFAMTQQYEGSIGSLSFMLEQMESIIQE
jgi:hypothetical protein